MIFCVYFELGTGVWGVVVHAWVGIISQTAYDGVSEVGSLAQRVGSYKSTLHSHTTSTLSGVSLRIDIY